MKYNKTRPLHYLWKTIRNGYLVNLASSITMGAHLTSAISAMALGSFFIPPEPLRAGSEPKSAYDSHISWNSISHPVRHYLALVWMGALQYIYNSIQHNTTLLQPQMVFFCHFSSRIELTVGHPNLKHGSACLPK